ncbi:3-octaprenyl-4-hydroxybenzoate carboxy-lyase [Planctomycetia bacterium]|nr:3-octaprenyl-4-hydroxybenzoate carboxy-lyase [Planctomycetia bacterium]
MFGDCWPFLFLGKRRVTEDNHRMGYRNLQECVGDLERSKQLIRIDAEVDPHLEIAEIQRRVYQAGGPALLFTRSKGGRFPLLANLFGTLERIRFLFRDTLDAVRRLVELKIDPMCLARNPWQYRGAPFTALHTLPKFVSRGPVLANETTIDQLPQIVNWPNDGGAFITLPQVYTEDADRPGWQHSNLGMYRVQLSGGQYQANQEIGLHYQIHRSIGVHHAAAIRRGEPFRVNIFVGGPPAMTLSAVMPLPEGMSELTFAGALGGRRVRMIRRAGGLPIAAEADFCIVGTVDPSGLKPEGPFGDHLGYYSLAHDFPVLRVEKVFHRDGAIWPFTVVGRPPQEDTSFGAIIHEITGPIIPTVIAGVKAVHAVDAAGVHPLLLAIGSERYVPYAATRKPQELLTCAHAILGQGQLSLAKYLCIVAGEDDPQLDIHDIPQFIRHLLERVDWRTDLHFQTQTTIDTLDYTGHGFNAGSKLVIAAAGPARRELPTIIPSELSLPNGFRDPRVAMPGVLVIAAPAFDTRFGASDGEQERSIGQFLRHFDANSPINAFPLITLVDDSEFSARTINNWLWTTFTRSNPAADVTGLGAFVHQKHWGCRGSLIIDARSKPHHAPPLIEDPDITRRVDALFTKSGPLHGL